MFMQQRPVEPTNFVFGSRSAALEADIQCAVLGHGGVLIIGPFAKAEAIAREVHRRGVRGQEPFTVVDCAAPNCLRMLSIERAGGTLLLRDVDLLSSLVQSQLLGRIADRYERVIASSEQCPRGALEPTLFYRLNMVRITLAAPSRRGRPERIGGA
jgi:DNA-binding NtrC family response regulator